jgi:hypothetical protein
MEALAVQPKICSWQHKPDGTELSREQLSVLEEAGRGSGVSLILLTANKKKEQVAQYVAEGNIAQFSDPRWAEELRKRIRFNTRDAVPYGPVMGSPAPCVFGKAPEPQGHNTHSELCGQ